MNLQKKAEKLCFDKEILRFVDIGVKILYAQDKEKGDVKMNSFLHPLKRPIKKSLATAKFFFCPSDETCGLCPQICYANVRLCSPSAKEFKSLCTKQEKQKRYRQSNDYLYLLVRLFITQEILQQYIFVGFVP